MLGGDDIHRSPGRAQLPDGTQSGDTKEGPQSEHGGGRARARPGRNVISEKESRGAGEEDSRESVPSREHPINDKGRAGAL